MSISYQKASGFLANCAQSLAQLGSSLGTPSGVVDAPSNYQFALPVTPGCGYCPDRPVQAIAKDVSSTSGSSAYLRSSLKNSSQDDNMGLIGKRTIPFPKGQSVTLRDSRKDQNLVFPLVDQSQLFRDVVSNAGVPLRGKDSTAVPFVDGNKFLIDGQVRAWKGNSQDVTSPIRDMQTGKRIKIGEMAMMGATEALAATSAAKAAFDHGLGEWPQMSIEQRCDTVRNLVAELKKKRGDIVDLLQWEICKTTADAAKEFDRTMEYIEMTIDTLLKMDSKSRNLITTGGVVGAVGRGPMGTMLCMGPFNYPFNETYCQFIPSLLMGNTVVMKIPTTGGLAHVLTMEAFAKCLPKGVVNFISGSGRLTMPPIMESGMIDIFAFIGGSTAGDALIKCHPTPHKLRVCLGLDAKNVGVVMDDADVDNAVNECLLGSTSYNGQRCTAIKIIFVHKSIADKFNEKFAAAVDKLEAGLPWQKGISITPLPEPNKPQYLQELISDAQKYGAAIINNKGGATNGSLVFPAVMYPVNHKMRLWNEEQFGPVVPIHPFTDVSEVVDWMRNSIYGQQAAIFTKDISAPASAKMLAAATACVSRVNINTQCSRSPDTFPFTGRNSSANGTLSVDEALKVFSVDSVTAGKANPTNTSLLKKVVTK
mmetsp:Transcript_130738/g.226186  ORF Transcript_130738/g.226186 Transcript_130738/m.226186 type:complete len:650 (-) Transcript_130738:266-2215(-)